MQRFENKLPPEEVQADNTEPIDPDTRVAFPDLGASRHFGETAMGRTVSRTIATIQWLKKSLFESPGLKIAFSASSLATTGLLCGTLMVEISTPTGVEWRTALRTPTLYVLLILGVLLFFYYRALYQYETAVDKFLDDNYCKAYMRSQCLPEAAERYKELIRTGNIGELERAMAEFTKVLK